MFYGVPVRIVLLYKRITPAIQRDPGNNDNEKYSILQRSPELESDPQIQFSVQPRTLLFFQIGLTTLQKIQSAFCKPH